MFLSRFLRHARGFGSSSRAFQAEHASTRRPVPQLSRSSMLDNYPALSHLADPSAQVQSQSESGALGRHNHALRAAAQRGDLGQIVEICRKLSDEGCVPNGFTYQTILRALGSHGLLDEAWAVWEDMEELGIIPTPSCYNHLLEAAENVPEGIYPILELMKRDNVVPTATTYEYIIIHHTNSQNLPMCLQVLSEMDAEHLIPTITTAHLIIQTACQFSLPKLALDIANIYEAVSPRRLDAHIWFLILETSCQALFVDGVQAGWQGAVLHGGIKPTEGLLNQILSTAARHAIPELASDALRVLRATGISVQEHHVASLMEAFVAQRSYQDAFLSLHVQRNLGLGFGDTSTPMPYSATYALRHWVGESTQNVDAAWAILEEINKTGTGRVDLSALNVVLGGAVDLEDMQRAIGIYKEADSLGVVPDVETLNILLSGCAILPNPKPLADQLIEEFRVLGVEGNAQSYELLIQLCVTQPTYEDAFHNLELMKTLGFRPSAAVYESLVRRLYEAFDSRWKLAMEEMKEAGFAPSRRLADLVEKKVRYTI